jgi:hypothetical protein
MESAVIPSLQGIRSQLADNVYALERLGNKFVGPKPKDENVVRGQATETVATLLSEISSMAQYSTKLIEQAHTFMGDAAPASPQIAGSQAPRFG